MRRIGLLMLATMTGCALPALSPLGAPCDVDSACGGLVCVEGICVPGVPVDAGPGPDGGPLPVVAAPARPLPLTLIATTGATVSQPIELDGDPGGLHFTLADDVDAGALGTVSVDGATLSFTAGTAPGRATATLEARASDDAVVGAGPVVVVVVDPAAVDRVWTGAVSSDWSLGGNWEGDTVPGAADRVLLTPRGASPVLSADVGIASLTIATGVVLDTAGRALTAGVAESGGAFAPASTIRVQAEVAGTFPALTLVPPTGATLTATGPVLVRDDLRATGSGGATVAVNGQTIVVSGNLSVENAVIWRMTSPDDLVVVLGNATYAGADTSTSLTAGVLELAGNFLQAQSNFVTTTFAPSGTHRTLLRGERVQQLELRDAQSRFHHLEVVAPSGVLCGTDVAVAGDLLVETSLDASARTVSVGGVVRAGAAGVLTAGRLIVNRPTSFGRPEAFVVEELVARAQTAALEEGLPYQAVTTDTTLTLEASVTATGTFTVQRNGVLVVGPAVSTVGGLQIAGGALSMIDPNGVLDVRGDAVFAGVDETGRLTAGELIVRGDLTQNEASFVTATFVGSANHTLTLAGEGPQNVVFSNAQSRANHVRLKAPAAVTVGTGFSMADLTVDVGATLTVLPAGSVGVSGAADIDGTLDGGGAFTAGSCDGDCATD